MSGNEIWSAREETKNKLKTTLKNSLFIFFEEARKSYAGERHNPREFSEKRKKDYKIIYSL
ncbi:19484_t:CDS:2, partial [Dentiscutata erythropus]